MALFKKLIRGGAVSSSKKMAPAVGVGKGVITPDQATIDRFKPKGLANVPTNRSKEEQAQVEANAKLTTSYRGGAQPMAAQATAMPRRAPLSNLRSSVKSVATNVKTSVEKQPALQKAVASQRNKPVGRVVGGLASKFLKRR